MTQIMLALDTSVWTPEYEGVVKNLLLSGDISYVKLGLETMTAGLMQGHPLIAKINTFVRSYGIPVMVDGKFKDKPKTMAAAVRNIAEVPGVRFFTLHADAGRESRRAALRACKSPNCMPILVTVLTSIEEDECESIYGKKPGPKVEQFAREGLREGFRGIVCSPQEVIYLRKRGLLGSGGLFTFTPGIRRKKDRRGDQKRFMTPREAALAGVDVVIIGDPIMGAANPVKAAREIRSEIREAQKLAA